MDSGRQGQGEGLSQNPTGDPGRSVKLRSTTTTEAPIAFFYRECDGSLLWFRDIHEAFVLIPEPKSLVDLILPPLGLNSRLLG